MCVNEENHLSVARGSTKGAAVQSGMRKDQQYGSTALMYFPTGAALSAAMPTSPITCLSFVLSVLLSISTNWQQKFDWCCSQKGELASNNKQSVAWDMAVLGAWCAAEVGNLNPNPKIQNWLTCTWLSTSWVPTAHEQAQVSVKWSSLFVVP